MWKDTREYKKLQEHSFFKKVADLHAKYVSELGMRFTSSLIEPEFSTVKQKSYQIYVFEVASRLAFLLSHCRKLIEIRKYVNKSENNALLQYNIENYYVIYCSLFERLLILVDRLFHFNNHLKLIKYDLIINHPNIQNEATLKKNLKEIHNEYRRKTDTRNSILHHNELMDQDLRKLEALGIITKELKIKDGSYSHLKRSIKNRVKEKYFNIIKNSNENAYKILFGLFDDLEKIFLSKHHDLLVLSIYHEKS